VRILAVSDIHGALDRFREIYLRVRKDIELVLFAGDIAPYRGIYQTSKLLDELDTFIDVPLLCVPGNMDPPEHYEKPREKVINIHGKAIAINNLVVIGVGGSPPTPFGTVFELEEKAIEELLSGAAANVASFDNAIVLSHSPPYATKCDIVYMGQHVGSKTIRRFIEERKPLLCVCGHIHESRAVDRIDRTVIVNPGPCMKGFYALIDVDKEGVNVELLKL